MIAADSPLVSQTLPSPNHGERIGAVLDTLILHYTGMAGGWVALEELCSPDSGVSSHYVVFEDGRVWQLVPEARRAWHAGKGSWHGEMDINSRSIGIEIVNPGHLGGLPPYPDRQVEAVIALCRNIAARHPIPRERVLAHSDTAPERKKDPGEAFPWDRLAGAGVGHHVPPAPLRDGRVFAMGDVGAPVEALQAMLALYGYDQPLTGVYDAHMSLVLTAFQRHFRQERVDGIADPSTIATLRDLIAALPERR